LSELLAHPLDQQEKGILVGGHEGGETLPAFGGTHAVTGRSEAGGETGPACVVLGAVPLPKFLFGFGDHRRIRQDVVNLPDERVDVPAAGGRERSRDEHRQVIVLFGRRPEVDQVHVG